MPTFEGMDDAVATIVRWMDDVVPQVGIDADFAQVDIDTVLPLDPDIQHNLASIATEMFHTVRRVLVESRSSLHLRLTLPVGDPPVDFVVPEPGSPVARVSEAVNYGGDLRGRHVPGFILSMERVGWSFASDTQSRVRLAEPDEGVDAFFESNTWTDDGANDSWVEFAVILEHHPITGPWVEAQYPLIR